MRRNQASLVTVFLVTQPGNLSREVPTCYDHPVLGLVLIFFFFFKVRNLIVSAPRGYHFPTYRHCWNPNLRKNISTEWMGYVGSPNISLVYMNIMQAKLQQNSQLMTNGFGHYAMAIDCVVYFCITLKAKNFAFWYLCLWVRSFFTHSKKLKYLNTLILLNTLNSA